jgi:hypothetical protein
VAFQRNRVVRSRFCRMFLSIVGQPNVVVLPLIRILFRGHFPVLWPLPAFARTRRPLPVTLKRFLDDACERGPDPIKRAGVNMGKLFTRKLAAVAPLGKMVETPAGGTNARVATGVNILRARATNCIFARKTWP